MLKDEDEISGQFRKFELVVMISVLKWLSTVLTTHSIPSIPFANHLFFVFLLIFLMLMNLLIPLLLLPFNWNSPKCSPPLDDLLVEW